MKKPRRYNTTVFTWPTARGTVRLVCALLATFASAAAGQIPTSLQNTEVTLKTVTDDAIHGELLSLSAMGGVVLRTITGQELRIPLEDVVQLNTEAEVSEPGRRDYTLVLNNADVIHGTGLEASDETLELETVDLGRIAIPLESIARIDSPQARTDAYRATVAWFDSRSQAGAEDDRILLTNGDVIRGLVTRIHQEGVVVESTFGQSPTPTESLVPHRLVVAIRLVASRASEPKLPFLRLTLRNTGRLTLSDMHWSLASAVIHSTKVRAAHPSAPKSPAAIPEVKAPQSTMRVEAERIVKLEIVGGRWEPLSSHRPISYQHTPMLSLGWEFANDRNVLGGPLKVAGTRYDRGIGVHSRSVLVYDLRGAYTEFVTSFGLDDNSGPFADVTVSVIVDGRPRLEQLHVKRGRLFGPLRLDIRGAKRIELVTDFGDNGDIQDRFNWIETALIR